MRNRRGVFADLIFICGVVLFCVVPLLGYGLNIFRIFSLDFKAPYKAEVIRMGGIFVPPVGCVAGYCKIEDKVNEAK